MPTLSVGIKKLNPVLGAEICGVDLSKPLNDALMNEIHLAWMEHLVLVFRDQQLTVERHLEFGRRFGKLHVHPATEHSGKKGPEFIEIRADENSTNVNGEKWHSDVSCELEPPAASLLYLEVVPPDGGGDTMFANMYAAYENLSDPIKEMLLGLTAIHGSKHAFIGYGEDIRFPESEHPIVRTHPVTGRKALFVNSSFTTQIVGLNQNESAAILEMLYRHIETPEYSFRVHWQPNTLVLWDNRCTQHLALWDYYPNRRSGRRATVVGERPFLRREDPAVERAHTALVKGAVLNKQRAQAA